MFSWLQFLLLWYQMFSLDQGGKFLSDFPALGKTSRAQSEILLSEQLRRYWYHICMFKTTGSGANTSGVPMVPSSVYHHIQLVPLFLLQAQPCWVSSSLCPSSPWWTRFLLLHPAGAAVTSRSQQRAVETSRLLEASATCQRSAPSSTWPSSKVLDVQSGAGL